MNRLRKINKKLKKEIAEKKRVKTIAFKIDDECQKILDIIEFCKDHWDKTNPSEFYMKKTLSYIEKCIVPEIRSQLSNEIKEEY
jgi:hypothetical protein